MLSNEAPFARHPLTIPRRQQGTVADPLYPVLQHVRETGRHLNDHTAHCMVNDIRLLIREFGIRNAMTLPVDELEFDAGYPHTMSRRKRMRRGQRYLWSWLQAIGWSA